MSDDDKNVDESRADSIERFAGADYHDPVAERAQAANDILHFLSVIETSGVPKTFKLGEKLLAALAQSMVAKSAQITKIEGLVEDYNTREIKKRL